MLQTSADRNGSLTVLIAASEAYPFAKTGGLGDVVGALPAALERLGHQPVVMLPAYSDIRRARLPIEDTGLEYSVAMGGKSVRGGLLRGTMPGSNVPIYFIKQDDYFARPALYGEKNSAYIDNCERFTFFCRASLEVARLLDLTVDVVHCNDWHTGLLPAYLKLEYKGVPNFERAASLMTIHNMEHQGEFWHWDMLLTGIDWRYFNWRQMEAFGKLNLLKTGLVFADGINTVSPRYAHEIQTPEFGCRLEGVLQHRSADLAGIINGVDYSIWNPKTDEHLVQTFDVDTLVDGKRTNKAALQRQLGLDVAPESPLFGFIGRMVEQKGIDLIIGVMEEWTPQGDAQWVLLGGNGDPRLEQRIRELANRHPRKVAFHNGYDETLAHRIEASADAFLMPSRFEPCGLNQLYSLKYGTLPVVHAVGGLANTVVDATPENVSSATATGFTFDRPNVRRLSDTLSTVYNTYRNQPDVWRQMQRTGMTQDWSWDRSAQDYVELYRRLGDRVRQSQPTASRG
jgi:starch synthase